MSTRHIRRRIGTIMALLIFIMIFAAQNTAVIEVQSLRWVVDVRRSILIGVVLTMGFVIGWSARTNYRTLKR